LGREFIRVSLGGVRDEAEIRGHRRTYIGALPGRVIQGMRRVAARTRSSCWTRSRQAGRRFPRRPVSRSAGGAGPEQNSTFSDHYLEATFDLVQRHLHRHREHAGSESAGAADRMEILEIPGYTREEKLEIARRHLVPKQVTEHGLTDQQIVLTDDALTTIIEQYTREAGVRNLEREIATSSGPSP